MYFYNFGDFHVVGASPEILVAQRGPREGKRMVAIRRSPVPGRAATHRSRIQSSPRARCDPKERAEHLMLIDLARNDIGRIAEIGSVKVTEQYVIEKYSACAALVSHVEGVLKPGMTNLDVLRATFPAGTLSGAPKVRAMEIIDELEPVKRGIYGGAAGYLSFAGDMDLAIAIRTGIIKGNVLYAQAAAGIVADSVLRTSGRRPKSRRAQCCARRSRSKTASTRSDAMLLDDPTTTTRSLQPGAVFRELGEDVRVFRTTRSRWIRVEQLKPDLICVSARPVLAQ